MTEGKTENRKGKEGLPQMGPTHRGSPAQGQARLLPRASQAAAAVASMPATPGHLLLPHGHLLTPGDSQTSSRSIPPLHELPPLLSRSFPSPPENSPEHRNAPAWPSTSRSQTKVSREFVVVVFIDLRKESEPDASTSSLASSSSPPAAVDRLRIPATPAPPQASHHSR